MKLNIYQVDAFTDKVFEGNPAAIIPLTSWLEDYVLQLIARENNLSETAFFVKQGEKYEIRWFTPMVEVDLCGHATLASSHVIFEELGHKSPQLEFYSTRSGKLNVEKESDVYRMNFPCDQVSEIGLTSELEACFNLIPKQAFRGKTDYVLVFEEEKMIRDIKIDYKQIENLDARGVIITAAGKEVDFISRFFGPKVGVPEDPVTGSAHTTLTPIWASKLNKEKLTAYQASTRGGYIECELDGDRVWLSGKAVTYLRGEIVTG